MTDIKEFVDRYTAMWNAGDAAARHAAVAELWAVDGSYATPAQVFQGREAVEAVVAATYEQALSKGFSFVVGADADTHHGAVCLPWTMYAPGGATVAAQGVDFVVLDGDGAITSAHHFVAER